MPKVEWQGSVPGKTFLFGEYSVLAGGVAVILGTEPRFKLKVSSGEGSSLFREGSPAHNLYLSQRERLEGLLFEFENPYRAGGFGASGAEFILLTRFLQEGLGLSFLPAPEATVSSAARVLDLYFSFERAAKPSSGSDVLTQWLGGSILYQPRRRLEKFRWPFADLDFSIFSTEVKVATHEHLAGLDPGKAAGLAEAAQAVAGALTKDENDFCEALASWSVRLAEAGLTSRASLEHAHAFEREGARLARGCGAMGADTLIVIHDSDERARFRSLGTELGLRYQTGRDFLLESNQT